MLTFYKKSPEKDFSEVHSKVSRLFLDAMFMEVEFLGRRVVSGIRLLKDPVLNLITFCHIKKEFLYSKITKCCCSEVDFESF